MKANKIKSSGNFLFWIGFTPLLLISTFFISLIVMFLTHDNNPEVKIVEKPEVIHDTVYVQCQKTHYQPEFEKPKRKKESIVVESEVEEKPIEEQILESDTGKKF
jgi:hypothetical protein